MPHSLPFLGTCDRAPSQICFRGEEAVTFGQAGGTHSSLWVPDGIIKDQEKWLHWFDARGIIGPRKQVEEEGALEKKDADAEQRWMKAMPASMRQP